MRVLIFDDEPTAAEVLAQFIKHLGHEATTYATRGAFCSALLQAETIENPPDAIIINVGGAGRGNADLGRDINRWYIDTLLICTSGVPDGAQIMERAEVRVDGFLDKPFNLDRIRETLDAIVPNRHEVV